MNSNSSITFNKQKMFNMYDPAALLTYFGSDQINPYLKNDYTRFFNQKEHYVKNPSLLNGCVDIFVGIPVQDQTGTLAEINFKRSFP